MKRLTPRAQNAILAAVAAASLALIATLLIRHLDPPSPDEQALAALDGPFVREWAVFWLLQKDADSATWHTAVARCADARAHRPNCTHIRIAQRLDAVPAIPEPALASDLLRRLEQLAPLTRDPSPMVRKTP